VAHLVGASGDFGTGERGARCVDGREVRSGRPSVGGLIARLTVCLGRYSGARTRTVRMSSPRTRSLVRPSLFTNSAHLSDFRSFLWMTIPA
jgi:hypothetical protein